jgi:polyisoprenoid-binding protein YceI
MKNNTLIIIIVLVALVALSLVIHSRNQEPVTIDEEVVTDTEMENEEVTIIDEIPDGDYVVEGDSTLSWAGYKRLVKVEHNGNLTIKQGEFSVSGGEIVSASVVLDMNSIVLDPGDSGKGRLEDHLRSDDFFSVANHPEASFVLTSFTANSSGDSYGTVEGELTIKDITNDISFPVTASFREGQLILSGETAIDRTLWNVRFGSGKFFDDLGDNIVDDMIDIQFELVASLQSSE